jgi:tRNA wybutosine-synthesizing protein 1
MFKKSTKGYILMNKQNKNTDEIFKDLKKKHYGIYGKHSAVEICSWNKKALRGQGVCYKEKFYNVDCHRCAQITPTVINCHFNCSFCWRPSEYMKEWKMNEALLDNPKEIVEGLFKERIKLLTGFKGNDKVDPKIYKEAIEPTHVAISLAGEPTIYPKIGEMVKHLKDKKMRSIFIVTNGMEPDRLLEMNKKKQLPTQLYLSIVACDNKMHQKINRTKIKDSWQTLNRTIDIYNTLNCRKVIRFTLIKGMNDSLKDLDKFIEMFERSNTDYLEIKSYMHLGLSRENLDKENMPDHKEVLEYSKEIEKRSKLFKIHNEQIASRIVLLKNKNSKVKDFIK